MDDLYGRYSPGQLLTEKALTETEAFPEEPTTLSFVGEALGKSQWKPESMDVYNVYAFNTTATARIASTLIASK